MKKVIGIGFTLLLIGFVNLHGAGDLVQESTLLPFPLEAYVDVDTDTLWGTLKARVVAHPFNLVATLLFLGAVVHTFLAYKFEKLAKKAQVQHELKISRGGSKAPPVNAVSYKAEIYHFLSEVEAIFGIWLIPLAVVITCFYGWHNFVGYVNYKVNYVEPAFVFVIMTMASTRPIMKFAESCMRCVAKIGKCSPTAWWFALLTVGPILGSFITEPAAMTITALLLSQYFYNLEPSSRLCYATLGLLFVNISVGGTLTHFAAPPVLMVASKWGWGMSYMFTQFGWKAFVGIVLANVTYFLILRKDFKQVEDEKEHRRSVRRETLKDEEVARGYDLPIPFTVTLVHILFLAWTVFNLHHIPLFLGGFLFFLAFTQVTLHHQFQLRIRTPLLVGFFLTGLVVHGGLQQWWIQPILSSLTEVPLFIGATVLTAFNDNAAITYLAQLVPSIEANAVLQNAVVAGAVAGGGLTVIANAPNPAGRSILVKFFKDGLSPLKLLYGALLPTIIVALCLALLP